MKRLMRKSFFISMALVAQMANATIMTCTPSPDSPTERKYLTSATITTTEDGKMVIALVTVDGKEITSPLVRSPDNEPGMYILSNKADEDAGLTVQYYELNGAKMVMANENFSMSFAQPLDCQ